MLSRKVSFSLGHGKKTRFKPYLEHPLHGWVSEIENDVGEWPNRFLSPCPFRGCFVDRQALRSEPAAPAPRGRVVATYLRFKPFPTTLHTIPEPGAPTLTARHPPRHTLLLGAELDWGATLVWRGGTV